MSILEALERGYDTYLKLNSYRSMLEAKFEKGAINYQKAIRLDTKLAQWIQTMDNQAEATLMEDTYTETDTDTDTAVHKHNSNHNII